MTAKSQANSGFLQVRGAREHNLKNVSLKIHRNALWYSPASPRKSSLAFGTPYNEAQFRYL
jgi:excinuclease ABC subunit A